VELPDIFRRPEVKESIALALREDLGDLGVDVTTESLVSSEAYAEAHLVAREACVIAGVGVAKEVFLQVNSDLEVEECVADGDTVAALTNVLIITAAYVQNDFSTTLGTQITTFTLRYMGNLGQSGIPPL
jgi:nicotinate-nucleotide pyrophosphorylase